MPSPFLRRARLAAAFVLTPLPAIAEEVVVFAAASMKTALDEIAAGWQADTGRAVTISYSVMMARTGSSEPLEMMHFGVGPAISTSSGAGQVWIVWTVVRVPKMLVYSSGTLVL